MAATTSGALKALVEAGGLSLSAYRDKAPEKNCPEKYVVIYEAISTVPDLSNNRFDSVKQVREQAQLTMWQRHLDDDNKIIDDPSLVAGLERLLDGAQLEDSPTRNWLVLWRGTVRIPPNRDTNKVQTVITVELIRDL